MFNIKRVQSMKLYAKNNIVIVDDEVYFIEIVGERLRLNDKKRWGITVEEDSFDAVGDIEISEWLLNILFKKKNDGVWIIDKLSNEGVIDFPYYTIERDPSGEAYIFQRGGNMIMYLDYVR